MVAPEVHTYFYCPGCGKRVACRRCGKDLLVAHYLASEIDLQGYTMIKKRIDEKVCLGCESFDCCRRFAEYENSKIRADRDKFKKLYEDCFKHGDTKKG